MTRILAVLMLLGAAPARAQVVDDSDLAGRPSPTAVPLLKAEGRVEDGVRVFPALRTGPAQGPAVPDAVFGTLLLTTPDGRAVPARLATVLVLAGRGVVSTGQTDSRGNWAAPLPAGFAGAVVVRFRLENGFWSIMDPEGGKPYAWEAGTVAVPGPGGAHAGTYQLDPKKENGKIGFIHLQFLEAIDFFVASGVRTDFWRKRLKASFPDAADYFSPWDFGLHLTGAEAWDVNLHELGHAVMAAGTRSFGGGGQHKIDECYNEGLAWSEGFATFFSGAVRLQRGDPDAKFEFLVPRRAPIRIENVPDDVCKGDRNEWRVAAGLWDLYDTHPDGRDAAGFGFKRLWNPIRDKRMGSLRDAMTFISSSLTPDELASARAALEQNTLASGQPVARKKRWWPWPGGAEGFAAPDFDGRLKR